jgi:hypothetical protein
MWAMMQKFRMNSGLVFAGSSLFLARGDKINLLWCYEWLRRQPLHSRTNGCPCALTPVRLVICYGWVSPFEAKSKSNFLKVKHGKH